MTSLSSLRPILLGGIAFFSKTYGIKPTRRLVVGLHGMAAGTRCSARYYACSPLRVASQLQTPYPHPELVDYPAFSRLGVRNLHTSNDADQDMSVYGTVRDLPVNAFSPEYSRWTTKYDKPSLPVSSIKIVSWNVDFMAPEVADRVACILDHLRNVIMTEESQSVVILLQELKQASFDTVLENPWVCEHFTLVPPSTSHWPGRYGLATLVSRDIPVQKAQILHFNRTTMGRAAIFVDVPLQVADANANGEGDSAKSAAIRIANTHLESLAEGERARPVQLSGIAAMLRQPAVHAGLVGGDMNMILPADQRIHDVAGLQDAGADGPGANTWGYQSKKRYQAKRMDRVFYTPDRGLVVGPVEVVGKGVQTERGQWASDHYAIQTIVTLRDEEAS